jgi:hypothetical protein
LPQIESPARIVTKIQGISKHEIPEKPEIEKGAIEPWVPDGTLRALTLCSLGRDCTALAPFTLGRHKSSSLQVEGETISRYHAELVAQDNGNYLVRDLDSRNGTYHWSGERGQFEPISSEREVRPGEFIAL